jgi:hypothetical protein
MLTRKRRFTTSATLPILPEGLTAPPLHHRRVITIRQRAFSYPVRSYKEGWRSVQRVVSQYAQLTRYSIASSFAFPATCMPSGNPSLVNPVGTEMAGVPVTLNGMRAWRK